MSRVWVLGADDAEMSAIEELLRAHDETVYFAYRGLDRVRPGQQAEGAAKRFGEFVPEGLLGRSRYGVAVNAVEVHGPWGVPLVDHHGDDPRASYPPERFWEASSLGQVCILLGVEPTDKLLALAAADHCLAAAWAGRCPGVTQETLAEHHLEAARLRFAPHLTPEEYLAEVLAAVKVLQAAEPALDLDPDGCVGDLTSLTDLGPIVPATGERYPEAFPHGPVVGALAGRGYITVIRRADGRSAYRLGGCGEGGLPGPEPVQRWLDGAAVARGCLDQQGPGADGIYGSPARGFGGGTIPRPAHTP